MAATVGHLISGRTKRQTHTQMRADIRCLPASHFTRVKHADITAKVQSLVEIQVKFRSPQNIPGASQQNSCSILLNNRSRICKNKIKVDNFGLVLSFHNHLWFELNKPSIHRVNYLNILAPHAFCSLFRATLSSCRTHKLHNYTNYTIIVPRGPNTSCASRPPASGCSPELLPWLLYTVFLPLLS